jgi:hypothetical protein
MRPQGKDKRDTNNIGDTSEAAIATRLIQLGYEVLTPFGGGRRYDLVIEDIEGKLWRIQCKTARMNKSNTVLMFNTSISNVTGKNRQPRNYRGQCDFFAAYCEKLDKAYLVPVDDVGITIATLRLAPIKTHQENIRWAKDYEL